MDTDTNMSGDIMSVPNSTMGPSAPPMVATEAACAGSSPKRFTPKDSVANVPISAKMAMMMHVQGRASKKLSSLRAPMPMNTKHAMRLLLNVKL